MQLTVHPGSRIEGRIRVPGDKSIAHRWLMLAATAEGRSRVVGVPPALDVRSTAACLARIAPNARPGLEAWSSNVARGAKSNGFTWDAARAIPSTFEVEVQGEDRGSLVEPRADLDCGNSGTTMRLLAGLLAPAPVAVTLAGDPSLSSRPMERVAEPLRAMGADVRTSGGHAPVHVRGGPLRAITYVAPVASAQLKSAVLLAACAADGTTEVREPAATRDHTERALEALGAPIERSARLVRVSPFRQGGFEASLPGDLSSAAFLIGAAALTAGRIEIVDVGLNPTRTAFLDVLGRMGVEIRSTERRTELGEPVGDVLAVGPDVLAGVVVEPEELSLVIDEVPVLAAVAAHARGETLFEGAGELRVKESDRLAGVAAAIRDLGGSAAVEGEDLVVAGGGLAGGRTSSRGDHRMAMAMSVAALAADEGAVVEDAGVADVSFPGFAAALASIGARVDA